MIRLVRHAHRREREPLLAGFPHVTPPPVAPAPIGYECHMQPGYRRTIYQPTRDWHDQELAARVHANARLARGDRLETVVDDTFTHLEGGHARRSRIGQALPTEHGYARFALTPLVRLIEQRTMTGVETVRDFPFCVTVEAW